MKIGTNLEIGNLAKVSTECFFIFRVKVALKKTEALMETEAFSQNVGKFPNLKVGIRELSFPESSSASLLVAWQSTVATLCQSPWTVSMENTAQKQGKGSFLNVGHYQQGQLHLTGQCDHIVSHTTLRTKYCEPTGTCIILHKIYTRGLCTSKFSLPDFSLCAREKLGKRYGRGELTQRRLKLEL